MKKLKYSRPVPTEFIGHDVQHGLPRKEEHEEDQKPRHKIGQQITWNSTKFHSNVEYVTAILTTVWIGK